MRILTTVIIFLISFPCLAQSADSYTDPRDGQSYRIELIDSMWWFADNLKYETTGSHCPTTSTKDCKEANFYPYTELEEVCPGGWHVSTLSEWEAFVDYRKSTVGVDSLTFETDLDGEEEGFVALTDYSKKLNMFSLDAPLNLKGIGWIEGKRRFKIKTITLWATHPTADNDKKYHLHIGSNSFVGHRHDHHIIDKRRRVRKFAVRCVKD